VEVAVEIKFTPSSLVMPGMSNSVEEKATVLRSSPEGGEYRAVVVGKVTTPQPQGPFIVQKGGKAGTPIEFANPYHWAQTFYFHTMNKDYSVNLSSQKLEPRKAISLQVSFACDKPSGSRLIVTCEPEGTAAGVPVATQQWVFLLTGAV